MQRSVRENIALPFTTRLRRWGLIDLGEEGRKVNAAVATLQIDARAGGEVRRLSGGNQQKVTIARWVAGGVHTMLCFDPTRGIDIRTKQQIYVLLRDLAEAGAAVLLYTSELKEVQLVCDRAIVIFGGRVVAEIDAARRRRAGAPARRVQPASRTRVMPEEIVGRCRRAAAAGGGSRSRLERCRHPRTPRPRAGGDRERRGTRSTPSASARRRARRPRGRGATPGPSGCSGSSSLLLVFTKLIQPSYGVTGIQGLAISVAAARPRRRRAGDRRHLGRDRPLDRLDDGADQRRRGRPDGGPEPRSSASAVVVGVLLLGLVARRHQRQPRRRHPGAGHRRHARDVVRLGRLRAARAPDARRRLGKWLTDLVHRLARQRVDPQGGASCSSSSSPSIWIPLRRSRLGLSLYAIGSNRLAAFRSGVSVGRTQGRRLHPDGPVRRARRAGAHREHRHRNAGARGRTRC